MHRTPLHKALLFITLGLSAVPIHAAEPSVLLDSLSGKAEVQRAGTTKWKPVELNARLLNNDVIRIAPEGFGRLCWPDESVVFLKGGSQILVNIGPPNQTKKNLNYATVFMGSVFFVIRKSIPRPLQENIRIYTPTTVISIRGTSFAVDVVPQTGTTAIKVISGTLRVRCIAKQVSAFVSAPFKSIVEKMTDPITTLPMQDNEIDSLRTWVPGGVIDREIALHLAYGKRNQMIIAGRMEKKCSVIAFKNASKYKGTGDLRHRVPAMFAERLRNASAHLTVEVCDSAPAPENGAARQDNVHYIVAGTITMLDIVNHAKITVRADEYQERAIGRVQIDLVLFDATGNTELLRTTVTGEYSGKKNAENSLATIEKLPFDLEDKQFASSLLGVALAQALDQAVEKISTAMFQ
jgi:hypothetical protein